MPTLTQNELNDIAEEISAGLALYIHKDTGHYVKDISPEGAEFIGLEEDEMDEEQKHVYEHPEEYEVITQPESQEAFKFMEEFVESIEDKQVRERLTLALKRPKPFKNFKIDLEEMGEDYRQAWFKFEHQKILSYLKTELESLKEMGSVKNLDLKE